LGFAKTIFWGKGFRKTSADFPRGRYSMSTFLVHSSTGRLRIIRSFFFEHRPDNVNDLSLQAGQGVFLGFPFRHFFLEIRFGLRNALIGNLRECDLVDGAIQPPVAASTFHMPFLFA
ncbi:MAG: hypothetical protein UX17_C0017G0008, partial [Parcubacteria group bacterium GW2011_GWC2_45_7]